MPRIATHGRLPGRDDLHRPQGPAGVAEPPVPRPPHPGSPPTRGVIVLTVKLFGETLKAPRTLAVWHVRTA
ncbi:hypothetical protein CP978_24055 [Streptomyces nodosus]|uniref:Uncharacterized protein n=1 Tax=Streptomyces nodosus TaxID=40318 RepID=A0A5P2WCW7_9ACTN|nr:hypothetical protein CP978_24055 [Streptomyces nodosus]